MKRIVAIVLLIVVMMLSGCSMPSSVENTKPSEQYSIGDEIDLGGVKFNIYKINDANNELFLLAQQNVATSPFSNNERSHGDQHDYEGSLVEGYVNRFVDDLEDKGYTINASGIIDKDDLIELGFDIDGLNGTKYKSNSAHEFIKFEEHFWVDGYCKYDTYAWVYCNEVLTTQKCENNYGVRPIIVINPSEVDKKPQNIQMNLTIEEIVDSDSAWTSEGGISNPYDRFYFDCENMRLKYTFESPALTNSGEYKMEFVDEKTIQAEGFKTGDEYPVEIIVINENKLRVRFLDYKYNDGDYYLNKVIE